MGCSGTGATLKDFAEAPLLRCVSINAEATHKTADMTAFRLIGRFVFEWRNWNTHILRKRYLRSRKMGRIEKGDEALKDSIHSGHD